MRVKITDKDGVEQIFEQAESVEAVCCSNLVFLREERGFAGIHHFVLETATSYCDDCERFVGEGYNEKCGSCLERQRRDVEEEILREQNPSM